MLRDFYAISFTYTKHLSDLLQLSQRQTVLEVYSLTAENMFQLKVSVRHLAQISTSQNLNGFQQIIFRAIHNQGNELYFKKQW